MTRTNERSKMIIADDIKIMKASDYEDLTDTRRISDRSKIISKGRK